MSEVGNSNIQGLLDNERSNEERLKKEIQERQEELLRCQGKILAFEELLKNNPSVYSSDKEGGVSEESNNKPNEIKEERKERAPRTTKKEMERRRQMVGAVFANHGDLSAKELQPLVEALLGYEMEPHHLRAVLRKFSDDFIQKNDHGIWGLTERSVNQFSSSSDGEETEDDSSESSSDTE